MRAATVGLDVTALSQYTIQPSTRGGLLLGFAAFPSRALRKAICTLAAIVDEVHQDAPLWRDAAADGVTALQNEGEEQYGIL